MKIRFEGISATITKSQIEKICTDTEAKINQQNTKVWNDRADASIREMCELAGHSYDNKTENDVCNGMTYVMPEFIKDYVRCFVQQALTEVFCDD